MMRHNEPDFYAVIREESKYAKQDEGKPFPVFLAHSPDGYIWTGNDNRYRPIDLWLLKPTADPTVIKDRHVFVFDDTTATEEAIEAGYQAELREAQWFSPLPYQGLMDEVFFIRRDGKRLTQTRIVEIRTRKQTLRIIE